MGRRAAGFGSRSSLRRGDPAVLPRALPAAASFALQLGRELLTQICGRIEVGLEPRHRLEEAVLVALVPATLRARGEVCRETVRANGRELFVEIIPEVPHDFDARGSQPNLLA